MLTVVELHHLSPVEIILQPSSFSIWGLLDLITDMWIILLFMNRGSKFLQGSCRALMKLWFAILSVDLASKAWNGSHFQVTLQRVQRKRKKKKVSFSFFKYLLTGRQKRNYSGHSDSLLRDSVSFECFSLDYIGHDFKDSFKGILFRNPFIYTSWVVRGIHSTPLQKWIESYPCTRSLNLSAKRMC